MYWSRLDRTEPGLDGLSVSLSTGYELLRPDTFAVDQGLYGCASVALPALVSALTILVGEPLIEVRLRGFQGLVDAFAEGHLVELLQDSLVEPLAVPVGPGRLGLGLRMVDVVDRHIQLVNVAPGPAAILSATVGQDVQQRQLVFGPGFLEVVRFSA